MVAFANSCNAALGRNFDSYRAKLFFIAFYICAVLKENGKENMPKMRARGLCNKPWKSAGGL